MYDDNFNYKDQRLVTFTVQHTVLNLKQTM